MYEIQHVIPSILYINFLFSYRFCLELDDVASFIICRPLPIVDHLLSAEFTNVRGSGNQFTEYRAHAGK